MTHQHCNHNLMYCKPCDVAYCTKCDRNWGGYTWTVASPSLSTTTTSTEGNTFTVTYPPHAHDTSIPEGAIY